MFSITITLRKDFHNCSRFYNNFLVYQNVAFLSGFFFNRLIASLTTGLIYPLYLTYYQTFRLKV
jgi:hypothetical protein